MIEVIKYNIMRYHGLPLIIIGIFPAVILDLFLFQDLTTVLVVPLVSLNHPYFDMTSKDLVGTGFKTIDQSLPLSFNKIWFAQLLSILILSSLFFLIYLPMIVYLGYDFFQTLDKIIFNWLIGYSIVFTLGKWILFKLKSFALILLSLISLFGIAVFIFNQSEIFEMLQNAIGIEQNNPLMVLVYIILMLFLIAEDYFISYLNRNKIVGLS